LLLLLLLQVWYWCERLLLLLLLVREQACCWLACRAEADYRQAVLTSNQTHIQVLNCLHRKPPY
jgi:hypothetical protein